MIYELLFQNELTNWKSNIGIQLKNFVKLTEPNQISVNIYRDS